VRLGRYDDAAAVINPALARSDAAIMDASRSRAGRARSVELVGSLYSLGSLCGLRRGPPDLAGALVAAEAGRARLPADALALDETKIDLLSAGARDAILAAREKRDTAGGRKCEARISASAPLNSNLLSSVDARHDAAFLMSSKFYELRLDEAGRERLAPAGALRSAQHWLRRVTFGELKKSFPIHHDADGSYLLLHAAPRAAIPDELRPPLSLRLGPDDGCPYAAPHETPLPARESLFLCD
jgi:hypothetical protein